MCVCVCGFSFCPDLFFLVCLFFFLQWAEHRAALSRLAVMQTLMVNQLVDMEWKFGGEMEPDVGPTGRPYS